MYRGFAIVSSEEALLLESPVADSAGNTTVPKSNLVLRFYPRSRDSSTLSGVA
jgi:hypothetical protein